MVKTQGESRVNQRRQKRIDVDLEWASPAAGVVGSSDTAPNTLSPPPSANTCPPLYSKHAWQVISETVSSDPHLWVFNPWVIPSPGIGLVTCI